MFSACQCGYQHDERGLRQVEVCDQAVQNLELPDGTLVSPPLEDLSPFLPDEEMDRIMLIPRIKK